ncbi:hypothetical protein [Roseomonas fluvialis]|uniref:PepSY domain-containing protein n=1 Tax=Roseomonas fluvialis TaxID=1750527 RepID=A0ABN6PA54_9PROT|nr:hypothetical protein [Roseomonas fluvialis]BDG74463.1 hypothetical protein Rmf_43920 [Roseomonas fluvialis]
MYATKAAILLMAAAMMAQPGAASAQTAAPAPGQTAQPPGTTNPGQPSPAAPQRRGGLPTGVQMDGAPAEGANSFTEGQARSRIEDAGYTQLSGLRLDESGVWRGRASHGGTMDDVALDFRGVVYAAAAARAPAASSQRTATPQRPGTSPASTR